MEEVKPWALIKEDAEAGRAHLCNLLEVLRHISMLIHPFMPEASQKMRRQLGLKDEFPSVPGWGNEENWVKLGKAEIIFPRIE